MISNIQLGLEKALVYFMLFPLPIFVAGNSFSSAFFVYELLIVVMCLLAFLEVNRKYNSLLLIACGCCLSVIVVTYFNSIVAYPEYNKYLTYGCFKGFLFVFVALFVKYLSTSDFRCSDLVIFIIFQAAFIFNAIGVVDFSLLDYSSSLFREEDVYNEEVFRREYFLTNNKNMTFIMSMFFILLSIIKIRKKIAIELSLILLLLSILSLLLSGSKTDQLSLVLSIAAVFFLKINIRGKFLSIFLLLPLVSYIYVYIESALMRDGGSTLSHRVSEWGVVIGYMIENPASFILGYGLNGYRILNHELGLAMGFGHNSYIQLLVEIGYLGLFLVFFIFFHKVLSVRVTGYLKWLLCVFVMQRLIAMLSTDVYFATDYMASTTLFIFLILTMIKNEEVNCRISYAKLT